MHKVVVIEFCSIVQIQKVLKSMFKAVERYIMFRKDEKGKLHKVVVVEPAGGKNRRQKFVRAIKGRCSIIYYIFSALTLHNCTYIVYWSCELSNSYCKTILCNCILYKMYENIAKGTMDSMVECFFLNQQLQHTIRPEVMCWIKKLSLT